MSPCAATASTSMAAYYKTITGRVAYIRTSRGTHSFSVRTVDTSDNRSYQIGATIRVR